MARIKGFLKEFEEFAIKGNMLDLAVGVIIGAAFSKIIDAMVKDLIMPIVSFILGGQVDFSNLFWVLKAPENYTGPRTYEAMVEAGANVLAWGHFVTILINFLLLAFVVFMLVRLANRARRGLFQKREAAGAVPAEPEVVPPPEDVQLLREIRDVLKAGQAK